MNENFYNQRKMRSMPVAADLNKNGHTNSGAQMPQNFSHNNMHSRQPLNQTQPTNHIPQNMLPQLVNLISPQISASQTCNQPMINMGFNATPFLPNQLYSLPNTFGALNTMASQGYGAGNVSYMNNIRMNNGPPVQSVVNYKEPKMVPMVNDPRKPKMEIGNNSKVTNYPVRLLVNSELVGPLIGRKGEKIKEITATTGAKIDIKRESVPYSQFGLNNYMFSGCNRKGSGSGDGEHVVTANNHTNRGESQIVFIVGEPEKCTAAIQEIMQLCTQEAAEQGREEPNLGLLAEDRFCARIIGKEGRYLNFVRCKSNSQVHVSNVPTITTLSQQPHIISLDRIVSCRGGGLTSLLEAERLISEKVRQCVTEDGQSVVGGEQKPLTRLSKDDSFLPPRATEMSLFSQFCGGAAGNVGGPPQQSMMPHLEDVFLSRRPMITGSHGHSGGMIIGSGIVHKANPNWPDNLKLDENLYVRIAQMCAGSIIGSEGKSVKRIMADTGTYVQISKSNLSPVESVPAVHTYRKMAIPTSSLAPAGNPSGDLDQRLVTIKGSVPSQCSALAHIYNRVKVCYNQCANNGSGAVLGHEFQDVRLWAMVRVPKMMLGRLIGKDGKVIRQLQLSSRTFLSFPRLRPRPTVTDGVAATQDGTEHTADDNEDADEAKTRLPSTGAGRAVVPGTATDLLHNPDAAIFGDADLHPVEIFGSYEAVECAIFMIRRLMYSCIFTQYGPALIPGPLSSPASAAVPLNHGGQLPPAFLVSPMLPWQRRNGDFPNPYYNGLGNIPRSFGPAVPMPPTHVSKNIRRPQYCQRMKADRRSQSEMKPPSRNESDDTNNHHNPVDPVLIVHDEYLCNNSNSSSDQCEVTVDSVGLLSMSPKRVLIKSRTDALPLSPSAVASAATLFIAEGAFCQTPGDELSQRFGLSSPPGSSSCYFTDCCSPGDAFTLSSSAITVDDLSFMTAQDSLGESSFIADPGNHSPSSPLLPQPQSPQTPPPPLLSQTSVANNSFSHWSSSPMPPF